MTADAGAPAKRSKGSLYDLITMIAVLTGVLYGALELRQFREAREPAHRAHRDWQPPN